MRSAGDGACDECALLRALVEASLDGVLVVSPHGDLLSWNERFLAVWGIPPAVMARRSDDDALAAVVDRLADPEGFLRGVEDAYAGREHPRRDELELRDGRVLDRYGAPLRHDGAYLGWAWYFRDVTDRTRAERALTEAGERFRRMAHTLQQSLLPPELPHVDGIEIADRYHPAGAGNDVGGDFYDLFRVRRSTHALVVGDVCGKGAEAAAVTALARYTIRAAAMQANRPAKVLRMLNEAVLRQRDDDRFLTVVYGLLRRTRRGLSLLVSSGGHPLPLLLRADGAVEPVGRPGSLIGVLPEVDLHDEEVMLRPGDAVLLYTDGLLEARAGGDEFGHERVESFLAACRGLTAEQIASGLESAVLAHSRGVLRDDTALLVLRVDPDLE